MVQLFNIKSLVKYLPISPNPRTPEPGLGAQTVYLATAHGLTRHHGAFSLGILGRAEEERQEREVRWKDGPHLPNHPEKEKPLVQYLLLFWVSR